MSALGRPEVLRRGSGSRSTGIRMRQGNPGTVRAQDGMGGRSTRLCAGRAPYRLPTSAAGRGRRRRCRRGREAPTAHDHSDRLPTNAATPPLKIQRAQCSQLTSGAKTAVGCAMAQSSSDLNPSSRAVPHAATPRRAILLTLRDRKGYSLRCSMRRGSVADCLKARLDTEHGIRLPADAHCRPGSANAGSFATRGVR